MISPGEIYIITVKVIVIEYYFIHLYCTFHYRFIMGVGGMTYFSF